jgi:exodeoxyribonuclease-3
MTFLDDNCKPEDNVIVMGDVNVSPSDIDIGIGEPNRKRWLKDGKCSFLPEEREWLETLKNWGLTDSFRQLKPDAGDLYSWFDYRSKGFDREPKRGLRIDLIMHSDSLTEHCIDAGIDYDVRAMEKPSDHAPIWTEYRW